MCVFANPNTRYCNRFSLPLQKKRIHGTATTSANGTVHDYINMARVDGAGFLQRNLVAFKSKLYTLAPTIMTGTVRGIIKFIGNKIGSGF